MCVCVCVCVHVKRFWDIVKLYMTCVHTETQSSVSGMCICNSMVWSEIWNKSYE